MTLEKVKQKRSALVDELHVDRLVTAQRNRVARARRKLEDEERILLALEAEAKKRKEVRRA
jgi:hypothetical protein